MLLGTKLSGIVVLFTIVSLLTFENIFRNNALIFYYSTGKYDNYFLIDT